MCSSDLSRPNDCVKVSYCEMNSWMEFHVEDNGPGIPEADCQKIFEKNWQARSSASSGNGLGLFIAKGIIEAHGGMIRARSEVGKGSEFVFSIPNRKRSTEEVSAISFPRREEDSARAKGA